MTLGVSGMTRKFRANFTSWLPIVIYKYNLLCFCHMYKYTRTNRYYSQPRRTKSYLCSGGVSGGWGMA